MRMDTSEASKRYGPTVGKAIATLVLGPLPYGAYAKAGIDVLAKPWEDALKKSADASAARRLIETKRDEVVKQVESFLKVESPNSEMEAVALAAADTLSAAVDAPDHLFYLSLARFSRTVGARTTLAAVEGDAALVRTWNEARADRLDREEVAFAAHHDRLILATARALVPHLPQLPGFQNWLIGIVALHNSEIKELSWAVGLLSDDSRKDAAFERKYLAAVVREHDKVELFIEKPLIEPESFRQELSVAYVSLNLTRGRDAQVAGAVRAEQLLDTLDVDNRGLMIIGKAGSGKTTLLRWAAVEIASGNREWLTHRKSTEMSLEHQREVWRKLIDADPRSKDPKYYFPDPPFPALAPMPQWRGKVPLLIRLRNWEGSFPPTPSGFHKGGAPNVDAPSGWAERVLRAGRALLLIDGLDELSPNTRKRALEWIAGLVADWPTENIIIVSSRPTAVEAGALAGVGFHEFEVANLNREGKTEFVTRWHEAVAHQLGQDADRLGKLDDKRAHLLEKLETNAAISALAENPLLCALLCALNRFYLSSLPENLYDLCDNACLMLLRDRDRLIDLPDKAYPEAYRIASYEDRRHVARTLAYELLKSGAAVLPRESSLAYVRSALGGRQREEDEVALQMLDGLVQRASLLRPAGVEDVEFVHNTLRDFLAACKFAEQNEHTLLMRKLDSDGPQRWEPVVLFAAATGEHRAFAHNLLTALLNTGKLPKERRIVRQLMALKARARMRLQPGEEICALVDQVRNAILPIDTFEKAEALAEAGPSAVDFLEWRNDMPEVEAAASVHGLARIDCDQAKEMLRTYLHRDHRPMVLDQLAQALTLEAVVEAGIPALAVPSIQSRAQGYEQLTDTERTLINDVSPLADIVIPLSIYLDRTSIEDIAPLSRVRDLRQLTLANTRITDISSLAGMQSLVRLDLGHSSVVDFTPLARLNALQWLSLASTQVTDLAPLSALTALEHLNLERTRVADIAALASLTAMQYLYLPDTPVRDLSPIAGLTALKVLFLGRTRVADVSPLAGLRELQQLYLSETQVSDINPLARLTDLQSLWLPGTQVSDVAPLADLTALVALSLNGTPVSNVAPLARLNTLERLVISDTQVADISPLAGLAKLQDLWVNGTHVTESQITAFQERRNSLNLPEVHIYDENTYRPTSNRLNPDSSDFRIALIAQSQLIPLNPANPSSDN